MFFSRSLSFHFHFHDNRSEEDPRKTMRETRWRNMPLMGTHPTRRTVPHKENFQVSSEPTISVVYHTPLCTDKVGLKDIADNLATRYRSGSITLTRTAGLTGSYSQSPHTKNFHDSPHHPHSIPPMHDVGTGKSSRRISRRNVPM